MLISDRVGPICYIVGAGECEPLTFRPEPGDLVIAADGGLTYLRAAGLEPDVILGDFDSLGEQPEGNVMTFPVEKDETDTFLALRLAAERGYRDVRIYGGLGGRLDHTLANVQTLVWAANRGIRARLVGGDVTICALTDGTLEFPPESRGLISVFCAGDRAEDIDLCGLKYPLQNDTLTGEFPLGVSNAFLGVPASVTVRRGTLIVLTDSGRDH